jgi:hypothetical protein
MIDAAKSEPGILGMEKDGLELLPPEDEGAAEPKPPLVPVL